MFTYLTKSYKDKTLTQDLAGPIGVVKMADKLMLDKRINANITVASVHVLLSKKSVVFLTPPNCCVPPPPKDEDKPPPFGFCTIITTISKNATITIRTKNIVNVLIIIVFLSGFLFPEFGLQRNYFFRDFSKLIFYMLELLSYNFSALSKLLPK